MQVYSAGFIGQGQELATVYADGSTAIWNARTGKIVGPSVAEPGKFFRDLNSFETLSSRSVAAAVRWEHQTGRELAGFIRPGGQLCSFAVSHDSQRIALGTRAGGGRIVDLRGGSPKSIELEASAAFINLEFSRDGQSLVASLTDNSVRIWQSESGQPARPPLAHKDPVTLTCLDPTGRWLVTWGYFPGAYIWDLAQAQPAPRLLNHESEVYDARFDEYGRRLVTASADWTAQVWDPQSASPRGYPMRHDREVRQALFTPDGRRIVTACADGTIRLWDVATSLSLGVPLRSSEVPDTLDISSEGDAIVCGTLEGNAYLCPVPEAPLPAPGWLHELAEALAGSREISVNLSKSLPPNALLEIEARLKSLSGNDFYTRWAKESFFGR